MSGAGISGCEPRRFVVIDHWAGGAGVFVRGQTESIGSVRRMRPEGRKTPRWEYRAKPCAALPYGSQDVGPFKSRKAAAFALIAAVFPEGRDDDS